MDKRIIGKWYDSGGKLTINIFDEYVNGEPKLLLSFGYSGYYNMAPNCSYEKDGYLCFELNDEYYRMVYYLKYDGSTLGGYYTQFGKSTDVKFEKLSDVPEEGEYRYEPVIPGTDGMKRIDALKKYDSYTPAESDPAHTKYKAEYVLGGDVPAILYEYDYEKYVSGKEGDELAFSMLAFVCDHFNHNGSAGCGTERNIEGLIKYCREKNNAMNCRGLALLLASLLRLNGFRARHITCCPYENPFNDCHVVVDCELKSGERIMFDPSNRLYYRDAEGKYVSLRRLRDILANGEQLIPNSDASHAGCGFNPDENRHYMIKNTFRFRRGMKYEDGLDDNAVQPIELIPNDYPPENITLPDDRIYLRDADSFWIM